MAFHDSTEFEIRKIFANAVIYSLGKYGWKDKKSDLPCLAPEYLERRVYERLRQLYPREKDLEATVLRRFSEMLPYLQEDEGILSYPVYIPPSPDALKENTKLEDYLKTQEHRLGYLQLTAFGKECYDQQYPPSSSPQPKKAGKKKK